MGAHQSIAGGYFRAVRRASDAGCQCVQLFTKNNNQWRAAPITDSQASQFRKTMEETGVAYPLAHDSYLINLASPDAELWEKSIAAFIDELHRAEILGIPYVVTHPGCCTASTPREGIRRVVRALNRILKRTQGLAAQCLLETTAGQGSSLGWQFEQLATMLDGAREPERIGICFDTCHVFAAGYAMGSREEYEDTLGRFDALVGLSRVKAFHLNDSVKGLGSRVDRHAHIAQGRMGGEPFRFLLSDPRLQSIPMYLETPKGKEGGEDLDVINLRTLRMLTAGCGKRKVPGRTRGGFTP